MVPPSIFHSRTKLTTLTFEEICPSWSNKLKADLDKDDLRLLIRKPEMCVGGRHGGVAQDI